MTLPVARVTPTRSPPNQTWRDSNALDHRWLPTLRPGRLILAALLRACNRLVASTREAKRAATGKTAISELRFRQYWYPFLLWSPLLYFFSLNPSGTLEAKALSFVPPVIGVMIPFFVGEIFFTVSMRSIWNWDSYSDNPELNHLYQMWLDAGGHVYWDLERLCNRDAPQVRAPIGRPPPSSYCRFCEADLTGLLGNCNFGNYCDRCGNWNDIFDENAP